MNLKNSLVFTHPVPELLARWLMGGVFIYSAVPKMLNPAAFAKIIYGYQLVPEVLINLAAIGVPFLELFAGIALVLGIVPKGAALLVELLLFLFILMVGTNLIRGHEFDCGCFSVSEQSHSANVSLVIRDTLLFLAGLIPLFFSGRKRFRFVRVGH